jgi:hypothetical protein
MKLVLVPLLLILSGCSTAAIIGNSADYVVTKYCSVPNLGRKAVRKVVDKQIYPNAIQIDCKL